MGSHKDNTIVLKGALKWDLSIQPHLGVGIPDHLCQLDMVKAREIEGKQLSLQQDGPTRVRLPSEAPDL